MNKLKLYLTLILLCLLSGVKAQDMTSTPLTLEATTSGSITFNYSLSLYHDEELTDIEYQINGGAWTTYTWNDAIEVVANDKVAFRGNNASYFGNGKGYESRITSTADVYVYGNVMSLINATDFSTLTTLTGKDAFSHLFSVEGASPWEVVPNTTIKSHPTKDLVLPATTLTNMCYNSMFAGCQGLTRAPELPATEMTVACYANMFEGCTSLTKAPALPTTTFTDYGFNDETFEEFGSIDCYMEMFKGCTSLTEAPALPATKLVHGVYQFMFQGCTSLKTAPVLPAAKVADLAYSNMFDGCTSLNYVKCLATEFEINPEFGNTEEDNVKEWLKDVAPTGTFIKAAGMDKWTIGVSGIPEGWTTDYVYPFTVPASGVGTFSAADNVTLADGLTAHYCTTFDSDACAINVANVSGNVIPASTGVLLKGEAGKTFILEKTTDEAPVISDNALVAVTTPTHVEATNGDKTNFMLKDGTFIRIADSDASVKMAANKAYLQIATSALPATGSAKAVTLDWNATADGLDTIHRTSSNSTFFHDLSGRRITQPTRGLYIVNGHKVVIK